MPLTGASMITAGVRCPERVGPGKSAVVKLVCLVEVVVLSFC